MTPRMTVTPNRCLLLMLPWLAACATQQQQATPVLVEPEQQYICKAKILFSDATREFSTRETIDGTQYLLHLGEPLATQLPKIFWVDSAALHSGRPGPTVTVGFAGNTGIRENADGDVVLQVGLQFQIFKPTGQSYTDIVSGQSSSSNGKQAAEEALALALVRLESMLESAGICRPARRQTP